VATTPLPRHKHPSFNSRACRGIGHARCTAPDVTQRRPRRLGSFPYVGKYAYFVTFSTRDRCEAFSSEARVECVRSEILRTCSERRFALPAGVFMPDHLHLLVRGLDEGSAFKSCMKLVRQRSSCAFRRAFEERPWQDGFFERVIRDADDERGVIRYIVENPVRAGLSSCAEEYPYSWLRHFRSEHGTLAFAPPTFAARNFSSASRTP
jgi:putative transposase